MWPLISSMKTWAESQAPSSSRDFSEFVPACLLLPLPSAGKCTRDLQGVMTFSLNQFSAVSSLQTTPRSLALPVPTFEEQFLPSGLRQQSAVPWFFCPRAGHPFPSMIALHCCCRRKPLRCVRVHATMNGSTNQVFRGWRLLDGSGWLTWERRFAPTRRDSIQYSSSTV